MTDTGRIKMEDYQGVLYCDAYMDDEFTLADLESMCAELRKNYSPPADVILRKTGSYSVTLEAQTVLTKGVKEFRNFVYVAVGLAKRESAKYAADSYMRLYNPRVASTKQEAYMMLKEGQ